MWNERIASPSLSRDSPRVWPNRFHLAEHVAGQGDAVRAAPAADLVAERGRRNARRFWWSW
jgi:hypothetical protein